MTKKTNTDKKESVITEAEGAITSSLAKDIKSSVLILSVIVNLYIFTAWIALQITSRYDDQLASLLFNR